MEDRKVIKVKFIDGTVQDCNYDNAEQMFADTEAKGLTVVSYWVEV